ncbi:phytosulfokines 3 [Canna indica]|uniref:Phytosulfokine n=1 Tax=Canna indica TaxID=4628 RepID=A0AAQ3QPA5_9LILI|nr:phytosulfokines 3 [Canna indica]
MSKRTILVFILLLLLFAPSAHEGRPILLNQEVEMKEKKESNVEACEGAVGKDECLARRTLAAHTDYIYTQEEHH